MRLVASVLLVVGVAACNETIEVDDPPVVIGVLAPKTGVLAQTGALMEQVALLAATRINAEGGIDGQRLAIEIEDVGDTSDPVEVAAAFQALVDRGAVVVVGPATQDQVVAVVDIAVATRTPFLSPISTTPWRAGVDGDRPADDGYMFRVVANDELQTLALAYYLRNLDAEAPVQTVVVTEADCTCGGPTCSLVEGDSPTAQALGVFSYFECFYEQGTDVIREVTFKTLFQQGLDGDVADGDPTPRLDEAITLLDSLDPPPQVVVLAGLGDDALTIITRWIAAHPNETTAQQVRWLTTATTKTPSFATEMPAEVFADLDAAISPISGSAPTTPVVGRAYRTLERAYADATGDEIANRAFAPNVWDAIYLAAAALTAQRVRGEDAGGPGLRTTLREVSRDGPILHAGQWIDLTTILRNGGDVDYDGASGPVDFKDDGEVDGPYEIWQVAPDGAGGFGFERAFYIDARNIPAVLETFGVTEGGGFSELEEGCTIQVPGSCAS